MRRILTLLAPDQQVYRRQCQTRGGIHRPDDGNPTHGMPSSDFGNLLMICFGRVRGIQTSLFVSSKVCAAPQTWYRGSRPIIATKPCSPIMVSPTATTRYGSVPARTGTFFFTLMQVLTNRSGSLQSLICAFCEITCWQFLVAAAL